MPFNLSGNISENNTLFCIRSLPGFWRLLRWVVVFQRDYIGHWLQTLFLNNCQHSQHLFLPTDCILNIPQLLCFFLFLVIRVIFASPCLVIIYLLNKYSPYIYWVLTAGLSIRTRRTYKTDIHKASYLHQT